MRTNSNITKIIIHHIGDNTVRSGEDYNRDALTIYTYGAPYDIIINPDGSIDLSAQWIYASTGVQYLKNVSINKTVISTSHHLSQLTTSRIEQTQYLHIALIGNFDVDTPSHIQIARLIKLLVYLCKYFNICPIQNLHYYNEFHVTSSPGIFFPEKEGLLNELYKSLIIKNICELSTEDTSDDSDDDVAGLDVPVLISPDNFYVFGDTSVLLMWNTVTNALLYDIEVSQSEAFSSLSFSITQDIHFVNIQPYLSIGVSYYWRVRAKNDTQISDWSDVWTFSILAENQVLITAFVPE